MPILRTTGEAMTEIENLRQVVRDAFSHESVSILVEGHDIMRAIDAVEAATLGRGECHDLAETPVYLDKTEFKCSECGYEYSAVGGFGCDHGDEPDFSFCPNCGRMVVDS